MPARSCPLPASPACPLPPLPLPTASPATAHCLLPPPASSLAPSMAAPQPAVADPTSEDYYKVLGVAVEASETDIKQCVLPQAITLTSYPCRTYKEAYKKAAIRWHPDKNIGDPKAEEAFKRVAEAYACLSKLDERAAYDRYGKDGLKGPGGMGRGGGAFDHAQAENIFKMTS
ncbi:hypothetical protein T492DRAFT_836797 [Pavlovales sp. CCMP2436]|nr:hypothetical protein T492DRAFT_836797 [Pavlovales sp. CCMP2436]